jgi:nucleotide-binding universal stress UspA family protein
MSEIVVGYDGSDGAERALRWAADEAGRRQEPLRVLCTWELPVAPGPFGLSMEHQLRDAAQHTVGSALARTREHHPGLEVHTTILPGPAAAALVDASERADLIVVGQRGHGAFAGLLLGSVSLHCTTHAACPVVVVPDPTSDR